MKGGRLDSGRIFVEIDRILVHSMCKSKAKHSCGPSTRGSGRHPWRQLQKVTKSENELKWNKMKKMKMNCKSSEIIVNHGIHMF